MVKQFAKKLLTAVAPQSTTALLSARARAHSHRVIAGWGNGPAVRKLLDRVGSRVLAGPFEGLILTEMTYAEQLGPYLLGVYESELDEAWAIVLSRSYSQVIDIGAKFGYYAVGLARKYRQAPVVAFDTDWWARSAVRQMAAANGTGNVDVRGFCSPDWLARNTRDGALIISDCEGYEAALFHPSIIARLRSATLVIETHDVFVPGVSAALRAAFSETHEVAEFGPGAARRSASCALDFLTEPEQRLTLQEARSNPLWLLCLPHTDPIARP